MADHLALLHRQTQVWLRWVVPQCNMPDGGPLRLCTPFEVTTVGQPSGCAALHALGAVAYHAKQSGGYLTDFVGVDACPGLLSGGIVGYHEPELCSPLGYAWTASQHAGRVQASSLLLTKSLSL